MCVERSDTHYKDTPTIPFLLRTQHTQHTAATRTRMSRMTATPPPTAIPMMAPWGNGEAVHGEGGGRREGGSVTWYQTKTKVLPAAMMFHVVMTTQKKHIHTHTHMSSMHAQHTHTSSLPVTTVMVRLLLLTPPPEHQ